MKNNAFLTVASLLLGELIVAIILWHYGFKITYAPNLENNWDALSACASCVGVISSFIAIIVAIQIPEKIADRQNKIALFEKRFVFYKTFCKCISFGESLDQITTREEALRLFFILLSNNPIEMNEKSFDTTLTAVQIETVDIINQGLFLFPFITTDIIEKLLNDLLDVLSPRNSSEEFSNSCKKLNATTKITKDLLLSKIETSLRTINNT